jgi:hypothetical protein
MWPLMHCHDGTQRQSPLCWPCQHPPSSSSMTCGTPSSPTRLCTRSGTRWCGGARRQVACHGQPGGGQRPGLHSHWLTIDSRDASQCPQRGPRGHRQDIASTPGGLPPAGSMHHHPGLRAHLLGVLAEQDRSPAVCRTPSPARVTHGGLGRHRHGFCRGASMRQRQVGPAHRRRSLLEGRTLHLAQPSLFGDDSGVDILQRRCAAPWQPQPHRLRSRSDLHQ